jgi:hypothetical protein
MAWTQQQLDAIETAIASGELTVRFRRPHSDIPVDGRTASGSRCHQGATTLPTYNALRLAADALSGGFSRGC